MKIRNDYPYKKTGYKKIVFVNVVKIEFSLRGFGGIVQFLGIPDVLKLY